MKKIKFVMSEVPVSIGWDQVGVSVFNLEIHVKDVDGEYISKLDDWPPRLTHKSPFAILADSFNASIAG